LIALDEFKERYRKYFGLHPKPYDEVERMFYTIILLNIKHKNLFDIIKDIQNQKA